MHISEDSIFSPTFIQRVASERGNNKKLIQRGKINSMDASCPESPASPTHAPCNTTVLILVFHAGSVLGNRKN